MESFFAAVVVWMGMLVVARMSIVDLVVTTSINENTNPRTKTKYKEIHALE